MLTQTMSTAGKSVDINVSDSATGVPLAEFRMPLENTLRIMKAHLLEEYDVVCIEVFLVLCDMPKVTAALTDDVEDTPLSSFIDPHKDSVRIHVTQPVGGSTVDGDRRRDIADVVRVSHRSIASLERTVYTRMGRQLEEITKQGEALAALQQQMLTMHEHHMAQSATLNEVLKALSSAQAEQCSRAEGLAKNVSHQLHQVAALQMSVRSVGLQALLEDCAGGLGGFASPKLLHATYPWLPSEMGRGVGAPGQHHILGSLMVLSTGERVLWSARREGESSAGRQQPPRCLALGRPNEAGPTADTMADAVRDVTGARFVAVVNGTAAHLFGSPPHSSALNDDGRPAATASSPHFTEMLADVLGAAASGGVVISIDVDSILSVLAPADAWDDEAPGPLSAMRSTPFPPPPITKDEQSVLARIASFAKYAAQRVARQSSRHHAPMPTITAPFDTRSAGEFSLFPLPPITDSAVSANRSRRVSGPPALEPSGIAAVPTTRGAPQKLTDDDGDDDDDDEDDGFNADLAVPLSDAVTSVLTSAAETPCTLRITAADRLAVDATRVDGRSLVDLAATVAPVATTMSGDYTSQSKSEVFPSQPAPRNAGNGSRLSDGHRTPPPRPAAPAAATSVAAHTDPVPPFCHIVCVTASPAIGAFLRDTVMGGALPQHHAFVSDANAFSVQYPAEYDNMPPGTPPPPAHCSSVHNTAVIVQASSGGEGAGRSDALQPKCGGSGGETRESAALTGATAANSGRNRASANLVELVRVSPPHYHSTDAIPRKIPYCPYVTLPNLVLRAGQCCVIEFKVKYPNFAAFSGMHIAADGDATVTTSISSSSKVTPRRVGRQRNTDELPFLVGFAEIQLGDASSTAARANGGRQSPAWYSASDRRTVAAGYTPLVLPEPKAAEPLPAAARRFGAPQSAANASDIAPKLDPLQPLLPPATRTYTVDIPTLRAKVDGTVVPDVFCNVSAVAVPCRPEVRYALLLNLMGWASASSDRVAPSVIYNGPYMQLFQQDGSTRNMTRVGSRLPVRDPYASSRTSPTAPVPDSPRLPHIALSSPTAFIPIIAMSCDTDSLQVTQIAVGSGVEKGYLS